MCTHVPKNTLKLMLKHLYNAQYKMQVNKISVAKIDQPISYIRGNGPITKLTHPKKRKGA